MAVAYVGRHLSIPVTIVVPETTSQEAIERIKDEGANVIVHGKVLSKFSKLGWFG